MTLRVVFLSPRPFGLAGTTTTYKTIQYLREHCSSIVVAQPANGMSVFYDKSLPLVTYVGAPSPTSLRPVIPAMREFAPDLVYLFCSPEWPAVAETIKEALPDVRLVLDIPTPLLREDPQERSAIQNASLEKRRLLDGLITHAAESVETWFPGVPDHNAICPPGIDMSFFPQKIAPDKAVIKPKNWVYIGSLHPKRSLEQLVEGFRIAVYEYGLDINLDVFGSGPAKEELERQVQRHKLETRVRLRGLLPQHEVSQRLSQYDGGIAWVPRRTYDAAPSLKVVEYMAAGLPVVATATKAHTTLIGEGFSLTFCEDDPVDVARRLAETSVSGLDANNIMRNRERIWKFDYRNLIKQRILPTLRKLAEAYDGGNYPGFSGSFPVNDAINRTVDAPETKAPVEEIATTNSGFRVAVVCRSLSAGKGGAEKVCVQLSEAMSARQHVVYVAFDDKGKPAYPVSDNVTLLPMSKIEDLSVLIKGADLDLLVVFYYDRGTLVPFAKLSYTQEIPLVVQECTNPERLVDNWAKGGIGAMRAQWEREIYTSLAARIRLTMPSFSESFPDFQKNQVRAFPNAVRRSEVKATPGNAQENTFNILVINGLKRSKNLVDLLEAMAHLDTPCPDWRVRVVGATPTWDNEYQIRVQQIMEKYNLWELVKFVPATDGVEDEFLRSHIHVIPSLSEGCPTVVLEAMACGVPSIGFKECPGTNELIKHERNGLLAASGDRVLGLANCLERLIASTELRIRLGAQAYSDAVEFAPERVYDEWEKLLTEASSYKNQPTRLFHEQYDVSPERALHVRRMVYRLMGG